MYYSKEILVPALTLESDPQITRIHVTKGIAREEWIMFPDGPYGLVHLQVWHHGWQVWPWSPGESFHWNNYVFHAQDRYPFSTPPYEVVIRTWNNDDFYPHHVTFAMTVDPMPVELELQDLTQLLIDLELEDDF